MSFDRAGQVLEGKYRLIRQLGEGGMGVVWAAEHVRLGRPLAVKLLRADLADNPRTLQRFHQEAVAASQIGNPHIVEVIDLGSAPNNAPFIVMELLEGRTLYDLLQDQPVLPIGRAADILCQVLSGLAAAHAKQIVHRDLKPANVFLTRYGNRDDFVKLVDFGVSKILGSDAQLTRSGALLGTPTYMAPEQVLARQRLDHRVDLWAAGVILYMALTGRRPHEAATRNELLVRIVNADVKPLRPQRREIDERLERIVLCALQRDVAQRWQSAEAFREALLPYRVQQSIVPGAGRTGSAGSSAPPAHGAGRLVEDQTVSSPGLVPADARQMLVDAAAEFGIVPDLVLALAWQESGWQQHLVSSAGAIGVMQVLPSTANWALTDLGVKNAEDWRTNPRSNIRVGAAVLSALIDQAGGNGDMALAFYVQGWYSVEKYGWFDETNDYVASVNALRLWYK